MRQTHGPAEKLFVDFAGDKVAVFDATTGLERRAHIFIAVPRLERRGQAE
jgi:transposase